MKISQQMPGGDEGAGFWSRFLALFHGYWSSEYKWRVRLGFFALVLLTLGQVVTPVLINLWSEHLFDALEQRSMDGFLVAVGAVVVIIIYHVAVARVHLIIKRRLQYGWRAWMTMKLLNNWLSRGRHHQINYMPGEHDNPDGRIAEDIRIATEVAIELGHSLTYCLMLLVTFISILWRLSGAPEVTVFGATFTVPGYLLYIALVYAAAGTTIAIIIGQPLVTAVNIRQSFEASFRFSLARVRENAQAIALLHGESEERRRLTVRMKGVRDGWAGQTRALANMMMFSATYTVLSAAFPFLVAAPRYIGGAISLGMLMQTAQAFQQTVAALSWPVDNLPRAAEWKASVERVLSLQDALAELDREIAGEGVRRIVVDRTDAEHSLTLRDVGINEPDGTPIVMPFDVEIKPGERVLIIGDPGAAIRLFRAVARVWPWGCGRIALPAHTRVFFMPEHPYLALGTLRAVLAYPVGADKVKDDEAEKALYQVGLGHLAARLDEENNWKTELAMPEQQRLGFARLLVRKPDWIFMEDAADALSPDGEALMLRILDEEFPKATLITIGSSPALVAHHHRRLVFERTNGAVHLVEDTVYADAVDAKKPPVSTVS